MHKDLRLRRVHGALGKTEDGSEEVRGWQGGFAWGVRA